jgi:hypothetical protein
MYCIAFPKCSPSLRQARLRADVSIERGSYLSIIGGCDDCHTDGYRESNGVIDPAKAQRGRSIGWQGPWGTTYATNLRPRGSLIWSRAALATSIASLNCDTAPRICLIRMLVSPSSRNLVGGDQVDTAIAQHFETDLGHYQMAGKPAWRLDDNRSHAVPESRILCA